MQNYAKFTCDAKGKKWYFPCSSYLFRYAGKKPHQDGYLVLGVGFGNLENI